MERRDFPVPVFSQIDQQSIWISCDFSGFISKPILMSSSFSPSIARLISNMFSVKISWSSAKLSISFSFFIASFDNSGFYAFTALIRFNYILFNAESYTSLYRLHEAADPWARPRLIGHIFVNSVLFDSVIPILY